MPNLGLLRIRSRLANLGQTLARARITQFYSQRPTRSYGAHFSLEQLGPPPLLERLNGPTGWGSSFEDR